MQHDFILTRPSATKTFIMTEMAEGGVMVVFHLAESNATAACSGLAFRGGWVVVSCGPMNQLEAARGILDRTRGNSDPECVWKSEENYSKLPEMVVTYPAKASTDPATLDDDLYNQVVRGHGKVVYMWTCPSLLATFKTLLSAWRFKNSEDKPNGYEKIFMSSFALIRIGKEPTDFRTIKSTLEKLFHLSLNRSPIRGEVINIETTPFGNEVFLNTRTSGLVCNTAGKEDCLVLSDAVSTLCSEGGPAFLIEENKLLGVVVSSVSWWKGEWVGVTLIARLTPSLYGHKFIQREHPLSESIVLSTQKLTILDILNKIDSTVVLIKCGPSWGSGIYLGNDYFITCSHVVYNHSIYDVKMYCKGIYAKGDVLVKSPKERAFDLALVRATFTDDSILTKVKIASTKAIKGENVVAVGFPYFNEENSKDLRPTVTKGQICNSNSVVLQTSCCVQSGCSGGAVMRIIKEHGGRSVSCELLGVIVCTAEDQSSNTCFPRVNVAVPVSSLRVALKDLINKGSVDGVKFEDEREAVQSLWRFEIPPPSSDLCKF